MPALDCWGGIALCQMKALPRRMAQRPDESVAGHAGWPDPGGFRRREAWRGSEIISQERRGGRRAKDGPQSNKRMHATRDTNTVMLRVRCGRARDARR
jgi:hypothetical protein